MLFGRRKPDPPHYLVDYLSRVVALEHEVAAVKRTLADMDDRFIRWIRRGRRDDGESRSEQPASVKPGHGVNGSQLDPVSQRIWARRHRQQAPSTEE